MGLPDLDEEVLLYCTINNILQDISIYYNRLCKIFDNVNEITVSLISDREIENYCKIRFNLKTKSTVEGVLEKEAEFKRITRKLISKDSRSHFILTTQIT